LRLEPDNLEVYMDAVANLQEDNRHDEALTLLHNVPEVSRVDPIVLCRSFISLYALGRQQSAFALLDASLAHTPDICATLAGLFPPIEEDPAFGTRVLNASKAQ
jgi:hypothetical protein